MGDLLCEICGPENECRCPPCQCINCAPPKARVVERGGVVDFSATREATHRDRLLWEFRVFGQ